MSLSRELTIVLLSSVLAFANVNASAWAAPDGAANKAPLAPAGAAGIKQAQGAVERPILAVAIGAALIGLWILLEDDDEDDAPTTTGT
jgi:hypothetical protein